ncbi:MULTISPECIES: hypothetical protein [unclassified Arthrobacter]|uniref:hypothetical protein n=1 Tax=unclassified Arthrobacter TaxID=235627 RepID=UPI0015E378FE|nr:MULTISPECIES: hypothetical protein [unclassified Arthrobacter]
MRPEGIGVDGQTFSYRFASSMTKPHTFSIVPGPDGSERGAQARSADGGVRAISRLPGI